jgi:hypothetical protein
LRTDATVSILVPRAAAGLFVGYTGFVVILALLFGGGTRQGLWSDVIVQLAALPLLVWALLRLTSAPPTRLPLLLLCAILVLPLLQLIPLPPALWTALPGRAEIRSAYEIAGIGLPWLPVSLDPASTWRGLLSLLPAAGVALAMLSLDDRARRIPIVLVLGIVFVSVPLDLLQMMGGLDSPLRFYAVTNPDRAVGFFANANHNATLLICAIPFAAAYAVGLAREHGQNRRVAIALSALLLAAIVVGLTMTRSRAGLALGFVAGLSCVLLVWRQRQGASGRRLVGFAIGANLLALLIAFQFGFVGLMQRIDNAEVIDDIRWPVAAVTWQASLAFVPLGSGLGTFVPVYEMFAPRQLLIDRFVNHVHNDWLELWLVGGVPALILAAVFLAWFTMASIRVWRSGVPDLNIAMARAASIAIVLMLLHSLADYPLRTITLSVLFALACSILIGSAAAHSKAPARAAPPAG